MEPTPEPYNAPSVDSLWDKLLGMQYDLRQCKAYKHMAAEFAGRLADLSPECRFDDPHARLHIDARERQERKKILKKKFEPKFTYRPSTNFERVGPNLFRDNPLQNQRVGPSWDRIVQSIQKHNSRKEKLERVKAELEVEGCTFSPQVISRPATYTPGGISAFERLYVDSLNRQRKVLDNHPAMKEEFELKGCTFHPKTLVGEWKKEQSARRAQRNKERKLKRRLKKRRRGSKARRDSTSSVPHEEEEEEALMSPQAYGEEGQAEAVLLSPEAPEPHVEGEEN